MKSFQLTCVDNVRRAAELVSAQPGDIPQASSTRFLAGGTTLLDLMKLDVERPQQVIDIHRLPLAQVVATDDGGVLIGATVRNSDLANHPLIKARYAVLSQALLSA